ncbi:MAG: DinB family protein [Bacteroidota bacterium]
MLQSSAKELLSQLDKIVDQCNSTDFTRPLNELSGATFGQHIRHTLEFFICLYDARNQRRVNYDHRKHDQHIETDKKLAQSVIQSIMGFLDQHEGDFELTFEANYTEQEGENQSMRSSFYRELAYNIEHAIHHMALIKVAVNQSLSYISLPEFFGVASSTIRYRAGEKAN